MANSGQSPQTTRFCSQCMHTSATTIKSFFYLLLESSMTQSYTAALIVNKALNLPASFFNVMMNCVYWHIKLLGRVTLLQLSVPPFQDHFPHKIWPIKHGPC